MNVCHGNRFPRGDEHDDSSGAEAGTLARGGWRVPGGIPFKIAFFLVSGESILDGTSIVKTVTVFPYG